MKGAAFKGSQRYAIPARGDLKPIWCERFGVLISPAGLQPVS
jgi:hypothetical protein